MAVIISNRETHVETIGGRTRQWLAHQHLGTQNTALLENYILPGERVPAHSHETEELLVCLEGAGHIVLQGEVYPFSAGSTAIIPAGGVHQVQNGSTGTMRLLGFFPTAAPTATWVANQETDGSPNASFF